jgi:DNA-binding NarL/FixJ family response regulator
MPTELIHILLVEDDDIDNESLMRAFRKHKIINPVQRVTNGLEALHVLRGEQGYSRLPRPYIMLIDINMPQMNGHELLKALRADPLLKRSVVFVLTSSHRDEDIIHAYDSQVAGYFSKSTMGDEFAPVIRLLNLYQASIQMPSPDDYA